MHARTTQPGYLLIELIAAITLVAIAAAALLPSVGGRSEQTLHNELVQRLVDLDRRARAAALADGPLTLGLASAEQAVILFGGSERVFARIDLSASDLYFLDGDGQPIRSVGFNRLGRTQTYRVLIRSHGRGTSCSFDGVSGVVRLESVSWEAE